MKQKRISRTRYYILHYHDGEYKYQSAEDALDAQQVSAYYNTRTDVLLLGTYDPQDWYFEWAIGEEEQDEHLAQVHKITDKLRNQYENRLR